MCKLLDGPGAGQSFVVKRCPVFLRVVHSKASGWDVLNEKDDTPKDDEEVYVYQRVSEPVKAFVDGTGLHTLMVIAEYKFLDLMIGENLIRSNENWKWWCQNEAPKRSAV